GPVGGVVVDGDEAAEGETVGVGDWAWRFCSQTFDGSTRARSRRTCSHVTRCDVTVVTALRRAATFAGGARGEGGRALGGTLFFLNTMGRPLPFGGGFGPREKSCPGGDNYAARRSHGG